MKTQEQRLEAIIASSPVLHGLFRRWALIDLWLSGSALPQVAWNATFDLPHHHGLADLDLVYFDPDDLSKETEDERNSRLRSVLNDIPLRIDAKNQARVHLWYGRRFGYEIAPYQSSEQAISTFPTTSSAIGIRRVGESLAVYAPFGLKDLLTPVVRPNKAQITQAIYDSKIARWRTLWPGLTIAPW